MKKVIINADDFGLSPGVNRGILCGFRDGIVTSTTMMVNLPAFDDAVQIIKENPDLPVGIHLTLLWGKPVTDFFKIPTLVCRNGCFPNSLTVLSRRHFLGMLSDNEIKEEFRNQILKFMNTGIIPTHLDTHKHIHSLQSVLKAMIAVGSEFGINKIRLPVENPLNHTNLSNNIKIPHPSWKAVCKRNLVKFLCRKNSKILKNNDLKYPDYFLGIDYMDILNTDILLAMLNSLRDGVTEIMCHPGYIDDQLKEYSKIPPHRDIELKSIIDERLKDYIIKNNIDIISYKEL